MKNRVSLGRKRQIGGGTDLLVAEKILGGLLDVLITTSREVRNDNIFLAHGARDFRNVSHCVGRLEGRNDPFSMSQLSKSS